MLGIGCPDRHALLLTPPKTHGPSHPHSRASGFVHRPFVDFRCVRFALAQQLRRQAGHVVGRDEQEALARALCIQVNSVPSWSFDVPPSAPPSVAPANIFSISSIINGTGAMRLAGPDSVRNLSKVHSQDALVMTTAPPALSGRAWNQCLKESHEFTCLLLGTADMRVGSSSQERFS